MHLALNLRYQIKDQTEFPLQEFMTAKTLNQTTSKTSWYDFPHCYDLGFRDETQREIRFLPKAFQRFSQIPVRSVFEGGCGSGRLMRALASKGYQVCGFDLNQNALDYCSARLKKHGRTARMVNADMRSFDLGQRFQAGVCILNTFRHLLTEEDARSHLKCAARHIEDGGLYILSLHLLPSDADLLDVERWKYQSKRLSISYCLRVIDTNLRKRREQLRLTMTVRRNGQSFRIVDEFALRTYRARQMRALLESVPELELCEVFDFWYEIDEPQPFNDRLSDAVFVLRKRGCP